MARRAERQTKNLLRGAGGASGQIRSNGPKTSPEAGRRGGCGGTCRGHVTNQPRGAGYAGHAGPVRGPRVTPPLSCSPFFGRNEALLRRIGREPLCSLISTMEMRLKNGVNFWNRVSNLETRSENPIVYRGVSPRRFQRQRKSDTHGNECHGLETGAIRRSVTALAAPGGPPKRDSRGRQLTRVAKASRRQHGQKRTC